MAKFITQETFDEVVKENIEDFGMDKEAAVADAIAQFKSQGRYPSCFAVCCCLFLPTAVLCLWNARTLPCTGSVASGVLFANR